MEKVYNERGKWTGYINNNTIYDRQHNVMGYMAEPMIMDSYGRTVGYMVNGGIYSSMVCRLVPMMILREILRSASVADFSFPFSHSSSRSSDVVQLKYTLAKN